VTTSIEPTYFELPAQQSIPKQLEALWRDAPTGMMANSARIATNISRAHFTLSQKKPTDSVTSELSAWLETAYGTWHEICLDYRGDSLRVDVKLARDTVGSQQLLRVTFSCEAQTPRATEAVACLLKTIVKVFGDPVLRLPPHEEGQGGQPQRDVLIGELSQTVSDLRHALTTGTQQYTDSVAAAQTRAEERIEEARQALAGERQRLQDEHQKRSEELDEREGALNARAASVIRRDSLDRCLTHLANANVSNWYSDLVPETRSRTTWYAWVLLGFAIGACATGLFFILNRHWFNEVPLAWSIALFSMGTLAVGSTLIYLIRWSDAWHRRLADTEDLLKRLDLDNQRAGWVAELAVEYREQYQESLPQEVVTVLTTGLFQKAARSDSATHPIEDLLGFVRRLQRVRVDESSVEVESGSPTRLRTRNGKPRAKTTSGDS